MLDELSITINNRVSNSVDNHPGMKPLVTGLDNISTSAEIIPILSINKINFLNFTFRIELSSILFKNRTELKFTFFILKRFKK